MFQNFDVLWHLLYITKARICLYNLILCLFSFRTTLDRSSFLEMEKVSCGGVGSRGDWDAAIGDIASLQVLLLDLQCSLSLADVAAKILDVGDPRHLTYDRRAPEGCRVLRDVLQQVYVNNLERVQS